jgi:hypothetical protein
MLKFTSDNVLEGILAPSDCNYNLMFKWLRRRSTSSHYIGDTPEERQRMKQFISGKHKCMIDNNSFFRYLDEVEEIVKKFKHMFYGPIEIVEQTRQYFLNLPEDYRYIEISYEYDDRYLKISKNDMNVKEFQSCLIGKITQIKFVKSDNDQYRVYVNLIENWREEIMGKATKCYDSDITIIFNDFMKDGLGKNKNKIDLARIFGIKYANLINNNDVNIEDVISKSNYSKDNLLEYVKNGMILSKDVVWESKKSDSSSDSQPEPKTRDDKRLVGGTNTILYGVPGAGKSWTIQNEYCKDPNKIERVVFHPDYTYSDFVGQILPKVVNDNQVTYEFTAGPFTKLVKKAVDNPSEMYYLIIEEINRGNAPAIFGDVFQLLDRDEDGSSEYEITNSDLAKIIYEDENRKVSIPSNMSILCTMNTSDQNVFTLDTAFQRRWNMRLVRNKFDETVFGEKALSNTKILDTDVTWGKFFEKINDIILEKNIRMTSSEDKRLGTHFIKKEDLRFDGTKDQNGTMTLEAKRQNSRFPEKVIKYLWDDAFKFTKEDVFETTIFKSLEDLIEHFIVSEGNNRFKIFKENIYNALII